jgi:uncharacterized protein
MGKAIFWVVVILGVLMLARVLARSKAASAAKSKARQAAPTPVQPAAQGDPEAMVRCAHCGVHLPRSEARMLGGNTWCSNEHAKLGARKQS